MPLSLRGLMLLVLAAMLAPASAHAAQTSGDVKRQRACVRCEDDEPRMRALERLDSLRWQFENERLSARERERLRSELAVAVRDLQKAIGTYRVEMGDIERARMEAWEEPSGFAYTMTRSPAGYLGVSFDGPNTEEMRAGQRIIRFYSYPRIALVEPGSPAERAGIRSGDTLLAMNGIDVVDNEISLTKMLVPEEALRVRLLRAGSAKDLKVVVGRPPAYVVQRWTSGRAVLAPTAPTTEAPGPTRVTAVRPVRGSAPVVTSMPATPSVWVSSTGVAGAKVETVGDGLGRALGVRGGVVILRIGPGTPASRAGLMDGDVIVRVAGSEVETVRELQTLLERHDDGNGVKLVIVRDRRQREVTLRQ